MLLVYSAGWVLVAVVFIAYVVICGFAYRFLWFHEKSLGVCRFCGVMFDG